jgi:hypothetical protein
MVLEATGPGLSRLDVRFPDQGAQAIDFWVAPVDGPIGFKLEAAPAHRGQPLFPAGRGEADLFVYPGFKFRVAGAMLTNFHLPQSTLLMMVCAFAGKDNVLAAYKHAVDQRYRFYSYGDCMFVE